MSATDDAEHWTFRAGENHSRFGKPYEISCQGQVQWDRVFYLYNVVAQGVPDSKRAIRLMMQCISKARRRALEFGWPQILWIRERKDGSRHEVRIPINPRRIRPAPVTGLSHPQGE